MSFTTILNGVTLANEPIGLDTDTSIQLVRDKDIQGLFTTLVSNLTFWGDGYDVIQAALVSVGLCGTIPISITEDCDVDPLAFEGLIYLSDVEIDEFKCTASVSAEDNSLASLVMRLKDTKVRVNNGRTIDGSALSSIGTNLDAGGSVGIKTWFRYEDLMEHVLNYITDNGISVVSTFLNTNYQEAEYTWTCTSTGAAAAITISFTDPLGVSRITSFSISPLLTDDQYAEQIGLGMLGNNPNYPPFNGVGPISVTRSANVLTLKFIGNISNLSFTLNGTGTVTPVIVKGGSYGANNVYLINGAKLQDNGLDFFVSFSDLIAIGAYYNLSFEFVKNGSTQEIRIEQEPDFFDASVTATITNAKVRRQTSSSLAFSSLQYAQQNEDVTLTYYKQASFVNLSCASESVNIPSSVNIPTDILPSNAADAIADRIYIVEATPSTTNIASYQSTYNNGGVITNGGIYYALSIANVFVARNYVNRAPLGLLYEGDNIPNQESIKIAGGISFEAPLTRGQLADIRTNLQGAINVNGTDGWISNLTYNIRTGLTTFELLTE